MRTTRVHVFSRYANSALREMYEIDGHEPRWFDRVGCRDIPADFPETSYDVSLGMLSFPELGEDTTLPPDACVSLVERAKRVVRVATLWELLALFEEDEMSFNELLEQNEGRPVIAWGSTAMVLGNVRCTPVLYPHERKIRLPSQGDNFPFGRYANLVVVE